MGLNGADIDNAIVEDNQNIGSLWFIYLLLHMVLYVLWFFHNPTLSNNKKNTCQVLSIADDSSTLAIEANGILLWFVLYRRTKHISIPVASR